MNIDAINGINWLKPPIEETLSVNKPEGHFSNWLAENLTNTNDKLNAADEALTALASGQATSLHQSMLALEEAKLSFRYLEQIRNRLMTAYQDILKEQI